MPRVKGRYVADAHMTIQEIATELGISAQRASQLEQRAYKKIRKYLLNRFGNSVKITDILPTLREVEDESMFCL